MPRTIADHLRMPNGFHGSLEEWERMESPFRSLDGELERFARSEGLVLTKNYHDWPSRWLEWDRPIRRRIAVHRGEGGRFAVCITAYEDRELARYLKDETIFEGSLEELRTALPETLERAKRMLEAWHRADLEFSTRLSELTPRRFALTQIGSWAMAALMYLLPLMALGWVILRVVSCART